MTNAQRLNRVTHFIIAFILLSPVLYVFWYRPFYGPMDDANLLNTLQQPRFNGWTGWYIETLRADIKWGMLRLFYPLYVMVVYGWFGSTPDKLFLFNAVTTVILLVSLTVVLAESFRFSKRWVGLGVALFPWTYELFVFPSLQERQVLWFYVAGLFAFNHWRKTSSAKWLWIFYALLILGFFTKAQFSIFALSLSVLFFENKTKNKYIYISTCISIVGTLFCLFIAHGSGYAVKYQWPVVVSNALSFRGLLVLFLVGAVLMAAAFTERLVSSRTPLKPLNIAVIGLGYWGIFVQRSFDNYTLCILLPMAGYIVGVLGKCFSSAYVRASSGVLVALLAVSIGYWRLDRNYSFLRDIRHLIEQPEKLNQQIPPGGRLYLRCAELTGVLNQFGKFHFSVRPVMNGVTDRPVNTPWYLLAAEGYCHRLDEPAYSGHTVVEKVLDHAPRFILQEVR